MKIPKAVIEEAHELIEGFGEHFRYLGKITDGRDVYSFMFPDNQETGFPFIFLYDGHIASPISGYKALRIISKLIVE